MIGRILLVIAEGIGLMLFFIVLELTTGRKMDIQFEKIKDYMSYE